MWIRSGDTAGNDNIRERTANFIFEVDSFAECNTLIFESKLFCTTHLKNQTNAITKITKKLNLAINEFQLFDLQFA